MVSNKKPPKKGKLGGRRPGAKRFAFELSSGAGQVEMSTFVNAHRRVVVGLTKESVAALKRATGGKNWTSVTGALAMWALEELRRQGKRLTIRDGSDGTSRKQIDT